ncbi:MAG: DNA-3-methyladenine glycosylase [Planctomycetia bacterium]
MVTPKPLPTAFFSRPADAVARELLGARLVVRGDDGRSSRHVIVETEAYLGAHDLACHGSKGMTARNATMFGPAGRWYVYLCYGMHWMLNVVTGPEGVPAAVLIRGVVGHVGPGRLTRALGIDRAIDGRPAACRTGVWIAGSRTALAARHVSRTPRIGVEYAGAWAKKPLRFVIDPAVASTLDDRVAGPVSGVRRGRRP